MNSKRMQSRLSSQRGLTLIELMVSVTLGLLIMAGLVTVFANNSRARAVIETNSRQLENGRYAMQLIAADLRLAGYLDGYYPTTPPVPSAVLPDPCSTNIAVIDGGLSYHVQGYNNSNGSLSCISDVKAGTDVFVVRHAASCTSANPLESGCATATNNDVLLQVSGCSTETTPYLLSTSTSGTLKKTNCTSTASLRHLVTNIYFIANNNVTGDGVPTLKRAELKNGPVFSVVPLVENIENMQLQYGLAASTPSGTPFSYVALPANATEWWFVDSIKIDLLSRNESVSAGYTDTKTYLLGGNTVVPFNDGFRRNVYSSLVSLSNPARRR